MKRNFDQLLTGLGGKPLLNEDQQPTNLTLGAICVQALLMTFPDEQVTGEEKFRRYQLAERLSTGGEVEVTAEEVALLKNLAGKGYVPLMVGAVWKALEEQPAVAEG